MSHPVRAAHRRRTARKRASVEKRKQIKAKAVAGVASEALNRASTVVALEWFLPRFIEGSAYAVAAILAGSVILFLIRSYHILKGDQHD